MDLGGVELAHLLLEGVVVLLDGHVVVHVLVLQVLYLLQVVQHVLVSLQHLLEPLLLLGVYVHQDVLVLLHQVHF